MKLARVLLFAAMTALACQGQADEISIAVASNFTAPMQELAAAFSARSGHKLNLSFGSSGRFYAQISNGAPFELFFSADQDKPQALETAGLVVADSRYTYAVGRLALWSARADLVDDSGSILQQGGFNKLALANPRLAPYGAAAVEVLSALGLEADTRSLWVQGENIAQAFQFVSTGNADIGFVALSQIRDRSSAAVGTGSAWIIPESLHSPIRQDAVLLARGAESSAARQFLAFMHTPEARAIIEAWGYGTEPE